MSSDHVISVCVIPARLGSKRVPEKVLRRVAGRTLLERVLDIAVRCDCFDVVALSTPDPELVRIAEGAGVVTVDRPAELTRDDTGVAEISLDACSALERAGGASATVVTCLTPAYPFLTAESVRSAMTAFQETRADFLMSVVPTDPHDFHWALEARDGFAELYFGDRFLTDRMHLPPILSPTGAIKIATRAALAQAGFFFGPRLLPHRLARKESMYIGDEFDIEAAEALGDRALAGQER